MNRLGWCCVVGLVVAPLSLSGQAKSGARTADGHPDLQGMWTNVTITPLERPRNLTEKAYFTPQEAADYEKRIIEGREQADPDAAGTVADPEVWWERGIHVVSTLRTSLIIDPADGRMPPLTAEAQKRNQDSRAYSRLHPADGPEDRSIQERCLMEGSTGPPTLSGPYNNNIQIVEAAGSVMMVTEMIHDVRVIPMDGRPHLAKNIRLWQGDPRGHWEGDTLVVDSTNFTGKTHFRGSDENLHLIERFRLADPETIIYQFTVDDPSAFSKPWTGELPMHRTTDPMYEFACHEGNRAMEHILINARAAEKAAAESGKKAER